MNPLLSLLNRLYRGLLGLPPVLQGLLTGGLLAVASALEAFGPPQFNLTALYLISVLISAVAAGPRWAFLIAAIATVLQSFFYAAPIAPGLRILNASLHFVTYSVVIWLALAVKQSLEQAQMEARHDFLTRLLNRRTFHELANLELQRSRRNGNPISIILLDVDNFRAINDTAGTETGDQVLIAIADTMRSTFRSTDISARLDADKFAAILPETGEANARTAAANLHEAVARRLVALQINCTCSLAVAVFAAAPASADELLHRAEELMNTVKSSGKGSAQVDVFFGH